MKAKLDPAGFFARIPLQPQQMTERFTPARDTIVLCHMGVPRLSADDWSLNIGGLVSRPLRLSYRDLLRRPAVEVPAIHQCAGSPLDPTVPKRRVCNVVWRGVPLASILNECGIAPEARYVWSEGRDWGSFGGQIVEAYVKDMPLGRLHDDVLLAYEMNGEALRPESGYPVRLAIPGFYGTNSVKWIAKIELSDRRATGPFTTIWYNDPVCDDTGGQAGTKPVWRIMPEALIVSPAPDVCLPRGVLSEVWGWAWADGGIGRVDLSTDGGLSWQQTSLEKPAGRTWQRFSQLWKPEQKGEFKLVCRAVGFDGTMQPLAGARNAVHGVTITAV